MTLRVKVLAVLLAAGLMPVARGATVRGRLLDDATSRPVAGSVELFDEDEGAAVDRAIAFEARHPVATATAAADGTFAVALPAAHGSYTLEAAAPGHARVLLELGLQEPDDRLLPDERLPPGRSVKGRVKDGGGKAIAGAIVTAVPGYEVGEPAAVISVSSADGSFVLDAVGAQDSVTCRARGFAQGRVDLGKSQDSVSFTLAPGVAIEGRVTDGTTGKAVAGAAVMAMDGGAAARTDATGKFVLGDLAKGKVALEVESDDHAPGSYSGTVPLPVGAAPPVIALDAGGQVLVAVVDARDRRPIAAARVTVSAGSVKRRRTTDAAGLARAGGLPLRVAEVGVRAEGYEPGDARRPPGVGTPRRIAFALRKLAVLSGIVVDDASAPVKGARVRLLDRRESGDGAVQSDARGAFKVQAAAGPCRLSVSHSAFASRTVELQKLQPGEVRPSLRVVLARGAVVAGSVQDTSARPLAGARVTLGPVVTRRRGSGGETDAVLEALTDADGRYRITGVGAGKVVAAASLRGYATHRSDEVLVAGSGQVDVPPLALAPGKSVAGRVVDPGHRPVEGAHVNVQGKNAGGETETDADGRFSIDDLDGGETLQLEVWSLAHGSQTRRGVHAGGEPIEIVLAETGHLRGRIVTRDAAPPVGTIVTWVQGAEDGGAGRGVAPLVLDGGAFDVEVPVGKLDLTFKAHGYLPRQVGGVEVPDAASGAEAEPLTVELERGLSISGRVLDGAGAPVPGALVRADPAGTGSGGWGLNGRSVADGDGQYAIDAVEAGNITLAASADGFVAARKRLDLHESQSGLDIVLSRGTTLRGVVRRRDAAPLAGARVTLEGSAPDGVRFRRDDAEVSDARGQFAFDGIGPGVYELQARAPYGAQSPPARVTVTAVEPPPVTLTMAAGTRIDGTVTGLPPDELGGVNVAALDGSSSYGSASATTDSEGRFSIDDVMPGNVLLMARSDGRSATRALEIHEGDEAIQATISFRSGVRLYGTVTRDGRPVAAALVMATAQSGAYDSGGSTTSGDDGAYEMKGLQDGPYQLVVLDARGPGRSRFEGAVTVAGDTRKDVALSVANVRGRVVDAGSGAPLPRAHVHTDVPGDAIVTIQTAECDEGGQFKLTLGDGSYAIIGSAEGHGTASELVSVAGGQAPEVVLRLPSEAALQLHITDARTGAPASQAYVTAMVGDVVVVQDEEVFGEGGTFSVPGIAPGSYTIVVWARGAAPVTLPGVTVPGESAASLQTGGSIAVELSVRGTLRLHRADGTREWFDSAVAGVLPFVAVAPPLASIAAVEAGSYSLSVIEPSGVEHSAAVTVRDGQRTTVKIP